MNPSLSMQLLRARLPRFIPFLFSRSMLGSAHLKLARSSVVT